MPEPGTTPALPLEDRKTLQVPEGRNGVPGRGTHMPMPGGRTAWGVDRDRSIRCHWPDDLCGKRDPGPVRTQPARTKGRNRSAAGGSRGGGLSLGVVVPSGVGTLTGGAGSFCAFPAHTDSAVFSDD